MIPEHVIKWIGQLRRNTFVKALEFIHNHKPKLIVETGCYRGGDCDGQSTRVLAFIAKRVGAELHSFDINAEHIKRAKELLQKDNLTAVFHEGDSIEQLKEYLKPNPSIGFVYLDSFDYNENDPFPSQEHHLKEALQLTPHMLPVSAILVDDCNLPGGGKVRLAEPHILDVGFKLVASEYQKLFVRE